MKKFIYDGHKVYMNGKYPAIYINGKNCHVHRFVWEKYHGMVPEGYVIHHKDENKLNWAIENLELLSRSNHIKEHKNIVHKKGVPVIAKKNELVLFFDSIEQAAEKCGTYTACIQRIINGKQKQSNGWTFQKGD